MERSCLSVNKNRIEGVAEQGERAMHRSASIASHRLQSAAGPHPMRTSHARAQSVGSPPNLRLPVGRGIVCYGHRVLNEAPALRAGGALLVHAVTEALA